MEQLLSYFQVGGFAIIFLSVFFEITKIPISPLTWLGNVFNKSNAERFDKIEKKIDEHIVQSYRNSILAFQNECIRGTTHSIEQYRVILGACSNYETYIKENNLQNGEIEQAMAYIKRKYQHDLDACNFIDVQNACPDEKQEG